jgi:hypothetical protein
LPILVRPVREQLEHDRVIRLLQAKWKKKYDVGANVGDERGASVKIGQITVFPDLVLNSLSGPKRLHALIEVETGESVNNLEAMAQWTHMSRARAPFQLYVPASAIDQAKRLCEGHHVAVAELWSYYVFGEQVRFTLVQRNGSQGRAAGKGKGAAQREPDSGPEEFFTEVLTLERTERPTVDRANEQPSPRPELPPRQPVAAKPALARPAVAPKKELRPVERRGKPAAKKATRPAAAARRMAKSRRAPAKAKPASKPAAALRKTASRTTRTSRPAPRPGSRAKAAKSSARVTRPARRGR